VGITITRGGERCFAQARLTIDVSLLLGKIKVYGELCGVFADPGKKPVLSAAAVEIRKRWIKVL